MAPDGSRDDSSGQWLLREAKFPVAIFSAKECKCNGLRNFGSVSFKYEEIPSNNMNPIKAILMAKVISLALMSMQQFKRVVSGPLTTEP